MKKISSIVFILFAQIAIAQTPQVETDKGVVEGYQKGDIQIFKSVPFAAAPVGELRWRAPQEHKGWNGVLECKEFSASPMQSDPQPFRMWSEEFLAPPEPLSEDCLYLNIWSKDTEEKKPVFVWVYGGGFNSGSAGCVIYDGEEYAKEDVVFVSINYRVNIFGYFAHPELSAENEQGISGNYGLMDQIQALEWVQRNIEAFGGDPDNVTIAGQSAGSMSIHSLVASPKTKGLFHKAIGQSGGLLGGNRAILLEDSEKNGKELVEKWGAKSIENLRQMPADELFALVQKNGGARYAPIRDNYILPNDINKHYASGNHNDVPFLAGWVTGDGQLFNLPTITSAEYKTRVKEEFGSKAEMYLGLFPGESPKELQSSMSKRGLTNFAVMTAHLWAKYNKSDAYIYEYAHVPVDKPDFPHYGAFHSSEVPFVLHTLHTWDRPWRSSDFEVQDLVSNYWLNFIKTGNPNGANLPEWKTYDVENGFMQSIDSDETKAVKGMYEEELELLEGL